MRDDLTTSFQIRCESISRIECEYSPPNTKMRTTFYGEAWYFGAFSYPGQILGRRIFVSLRGQSPFTAEDASWLVSQGVPDAVGFLETAGNEKLSQSEKSGDQSRPDNNLSLFLPMDPFNLMLGVLHGNLTGECTVDLAIKLAGKSFVESLPVSQRAPLLSIVHPKDIDLSVPRLFAVVAASVERNQKDSNN